MIEELYAEELELELEDEAPLSDPLEARRALIILRQAERRIDELERTRDAVRRTYDDEIAKHEWRIEAEKRRLAGYVREHGNASFPDVGTAYLRKTKPAVKILDADTVKAEYGELFTKTVESFDETDFKRWALEQIQTSGIVPEGVELVPASKTLALRKPK
jgi:hypothetical protein